MNDDPGDASVVAALYVDTAGPYYNLADVDPWDETRDARQYEGPHPVVAHPPCSTWSVLANVNAAQYETFHIGNDGGCFAAALHAVRTYGGVIEHPAHSLAWNHFHLPKPIRDGWTTTFTDPGMTTEVSQVAYGHPARKRTWLYAVGIEPYALDWTEPPHTMRIGHDRSYPDTPSIRDKRAIHTPAAFREVLIDMARSVSDDRSSRGGGSREHPQP